jgi:dihydropyrimidinase/dihydroorotase
MSDGADLRVTNARVVTPSGTTDGGVAVSDGTIVEVGAEANLPDAEEEIDAGGNYLIPGFIDPHVHWGLSRYEFEDYHEGLAHDFETETRGAVHGGVTSVVNFLLQKEPYGPDMDFFREVGTENSYIDFAYHAIVHQDHHVEEIEDLAAEGVRSFKVFFNWYKHASPELGIDHSDAGRVYRVLDKVADIPHGVVMFHAENEDLAIERRRELQEEDRNDLSAWTEAAPNICEAMQIEQIGRLTEYTDSRAYVVHMSTGEGVDICERFQEQGVNLHAETLPAFLAHTYEEDLGVWGKISPPLRGEASRKRLWEGIRTGVVDYVGTDHCPHKIEFKEKGEGKYGDVWDAIPGDNNGIEYFLPVMMSEGVNQNRISMERCVEVCSTNNAKRWGLYPRKGAIAEGSDADMVIVDLEKSAVVDDDFYHTMEPRYSSFHGRELTGLPTHTIVGGEVVVEDGQLLAEPGGREFLPRYDGGVPSA